MRPKQARVFAAKMLEGSDGELDQAMDLRRSYAIGTGVSGGTYPEPCIGIIFQNKGDSKRRAPDLTNAKNRLTMAHWYEDQINHTHSSFNGR